MNMVGLVPVKNQLFQSKNYQHERNLQPEFEPANHDIVNYLSYKSNHPQIANKTGVKRKSLKYRQRHKGRRRLRRLRKLKMLHKERFNPMTNQNRKLYHKHKRLRTRRRQKPHRYSKRYEFNYWNQHL